VTDLLFVSPAHLPRIPGDMVVVLVGPQTRSEMRREAARLGVIGHPAVVEGGAAIQIPRQARAALACLDGPAWVAAGDEAIIELGRPLRDWIDGLDTIAQWGGEAISIARDGREYSAVVDFHSDISAKLEPFAARQDVRLSRIGPMWLLHARFGRAAACQQLKELYARLYPGLRTFACGVDDLAAADATINSIEEIPPH
jgi:hypothetical protein